MRQKSNISCVALKFHSQHVDAGLTSFGFSTYSQNALPVTEWVFWRRGCSRPHLHVGMICHSKLPIGVRVCVCMRERGWPFLSFVFVGPCAGLVTAPGFTSDIQNKLQCFLNDTQCNKAYLGQKWRQKYIKFIISWISGDPHWARLITKWLISVTYISFFGIQSTLSQSLRKYLELLWWNRGNCCNYWCFCSSFFHKTRSKYSLFHL